MNERNVPEAAASDNSRSNALQPATLWIALGKGLRLGVALGAVLATIVATALWTMDEPEYQSISTLEILPTVPYLVFPDTSDKSPPDNAEMHVALLKDRSLIVQALKTSNLATLPELQRLPQNEDPALWIGRRMQVTRIGNSDLFRATLIAGDPESAQKILSSIVRTYMRDRESSSDEKRQRLLALLQDEQKLRERDIELKRQKLRALLKEGDLPHAMAIPGLVAGRPTRASVPAARLADAIHQRAVTSEIELEALRERVAAMKEECSLPIQIAENELDAALSRDKEIRQLSRELKIKRTRRAAQSEATREESSSLQGEIAATEEELEHFKSELRPLLREELEADVKRAQREALKHAESKLALESRIHEGLLARLTTERRESGDAGDRSLEIEFARTELERSEEVARRVSDRIVQLVTESRALSQTKVVADASLPQFPQGRALGWRLAAAAFLAFQGPVILCPAIFAFIFLVRNPKS